MTDLLKNIPSYFASTWDVLILIAFSLVIAVFLGLILGYVLPDKEQSDE